MSYLDIECKHDVSDDDCRKCFKRGIIFSCPPNCEYFEEVERWNLENWTDIISE